MTLACQPAEVVAFCGRGGVRERNEDAVSIDGEPVLPEKLFRRELAKGEDHLFLVADGLGGHAKGELASRLAIQVIGSIWRKCRAEFHAVETVRAANRTIYDSMASNSALTGMGSTIVGVHVSAFMVSWFNLGDSRGYLFRQGSLRQFTTDHVPRGETSDGSARSHNITQSLGGARRFIDVWPATGAIEMDRDDLLLLCTDGLTDAVQDLAIREVLKHPSPLIDAAGRLVQLVEENGAPDNVSMVLIKT